MACCSVVSHWCKWCMFPSMFIMLPCSQRALILVLEHVGNFGVIAAAWLQPPWLRCTLCVQILSFYATRWPELPKCMQLTLANTLKLVCYAAIVGCSVWVMLCRCEVIPLKIWSFVSVAVHISARHNLFVSTDLIFYMKSVIYYG